ncbi:MAG TPA: hypothetical protein VG122_26145, partial [Gemmata sp.]|nr:hypothetical protein [Gemmata sp.]
MLRWNRLRPGTRLVAFALAFLGVAPSAHAYIDLAATLPRIISDSQKITVVEVVDLKREKRGLVL